MSVNNKLLKISGGFPTIQMTLKYLIQVYGKEAKLFDVLKRINKA